MQIFKERKGISLGQIPEVFRIALIIGITVGLSYIVLAAFQASVNNTSRAYAGMGYMLTFMDNIAANMPIVGFVIFAVIVIYLLNMYQTGQAKKKGGA